jgi:imidazolonepropionase-like amidohydrolase
MKTLKIEKNKEIILVPEYVADVLNGKLIKDKAVLIKSGYIKELIDKESLYNYSAEKIINLPEITLLPGLIDPHVHFALDGVDFKSAIKRWEDEDAVNKQNKMMLNSFINNGIVAVRDGSDKACIGLKAKELVQNGDCDGPIVKTTGFAIRKDGYYGTFLGPGVKTVEDAKEQINQLVSIGVDQIKVVVSGIVSFKTYGKVGSVQFSKEELTEIVKECHDKGLKVMAHASSDEAVKTAAEAKVDTIEHGYFISDKTLELMIKNNATWIPTVVPVVAQTKEPYKSNYSSEELKVLDKTYMPHLTKIKDAFYSNVSIGIGTDAGAIGVPHGEAFVDELLLYREAGISNKDILKMATINNAEIIEEDDLGSIEPGKKADLIGVKGNPLENISTLKEIKLLTRVI